MTETLVESRSILVALEVVENLGEDKIPAIHNILKEIPVQRDGGFVPKQGEDFDCKV